MKLRCEKNKLLITDSDFLTSGSRGINTVEFDFDESWDGYEKYAVFMSETASYELLIIDNKCGMPNGILADKGILHMGVYGLKDECKIATQVVAVGRIWRGTPPASSPEPPPPSVYDNIVKQLNKLVNMTATAKAGSQTSVDVDLSGEHVILNFTVEKGDKGDKGDPGKDGYTPVRGTDYWTDDDKAAMDADIAAQVTGKVDKEDGKALSSNDYTDADRKAVDFLGKKVTLLKEITTTDEATVIELLPNTKIKNFLVDVEIAQAAVNSSAQLLLAYADGSNLYCTLSSSARTDRSNKSSFVGFDIHGVQSVFCRNTGTYGMGSAAAPVVCVHTGDNTIKKIRYQVIGSGATVPIGSKFSIYGVVED